MEVLNVLEQAVKACADVIRWGAGLQNRCLEEARVCLESTHVTVNLQAFEFH